jgi:hypothetical protein
VIGRPPSEVGGVHETNEVEFWFEVADTPVGEPGRPTAVTEADGSERLPDPPELHA